MMMNGRFFYHMQNIQTQIGILLQEIKYYYETMRQASSLVLHDIKAGCVTYM